MTVNKYGLSRSIPAAVRSQVRKRCNFGCVICGAFIVDYEHFRPDFADARKHDPDGITLLCPQHHARVTRKFLSKEQVAIADLQVRKSPIPIKETFTWGRDLPELRIGNVTGTSLAPITVFGAPLLEFKRPPTSSEPLLLSAYLFNSLGELSLLIEDNEWRPFPDATWDLVASAGVISISERNNEECLRVRIEEPGILHIEKLKMRIRNTLLNATPDRLEVINLDGTRGNYVIDGGCSIDRLEIFPDIHR